MKMSYIISMALHSDHTPNRVALFNATRNCSTVNLLKQFILFSEMKGKMTYDAVKKPMVDSGLEPPVLSQLHKIHDCI